VSARDELVEIIQDCGEYIPGSHADDYVSPSKAADAILAAGYRRPRVVTTVAELDALSKAAAILDANGSPFINDGDDQDPWCSPVESFEGGPCWFDSSSILLPATVLHEPDGSI